MNFVFALLAYAYECYQIESALMGIAYNKVFELTLSPKSDYTCAVFDGRPAVCYLQYFDGATLKEISAPYTHSATKPVVVYFALSSQADYDAIQKQERLAYRTVIDSVFTPAAGAVYYISHTQMDSTQCWNNMVLKFDDTPGRQIISMEGEPLDCQINSATVSVYYWDDEIGSWGSVTVYGEVQSGEDPNKIFIRNQPFNATYNFYSITVYRETTPHLQALIEAEKSGGNDPDVIQQYTSDYDSMMRMINILEYKKQTQTRIFMKTQFRPGNSTHPELTQDVIGDSNWRIRTYTGKCFALPQSYLYPGVYVRNNSMSFDFMRSYYINTEGCIPGEIYEVQLYFRIDFFNGTLFLNTTEPVRAPSNNLVEAPGFTFPLDELNINEIKAIQFNAFFFSKDADGNVLLMQAVQGYPKLACVDEFHMEYMPGKACVRLRFNQSDRCKIEAKSTYLGFLANKKNLKGYECFSFDIEFSETEKIFCTERKYKVVFGLDIGGDDKSRYAEFRRDYKQKDNGIVVGFIGGSDMIVDHYLTFARSAKDYITVYASATGVLVTVALIVGTLIHRLSK